MLIRIDPFAATPVFEQIVFQVKTAVARGDLEPGDKLPSVREIAKDIAVNPNTVVRALEALERDRVIVRRQGAGCFVAPPSSDLTVKARQRQLDEALDRVVTEAFHLGLTARDVRSAVDDALKRIVLPPGGSSNRRSSS
jgi:GntR family transcriptional regulator